MASWQTEIRELLDYGRRLGLTFEQAWAEAVACVEVPGMCQRAGGRVQLALGDPPPQSVLAFFREACRRAWLGEEVAPEGCFDTVLDTGGVAGHGKSRVPN